jgi:radical SAM protein with 4Fe4S-binding SPASM domain
MIGYSGFLIDPEGDIHICRNMEPIGNIKHDLPEEAWNSEKAKEVRKKIWNCTRSCKILACNTLDQGEDNKD